MFKESGICDDFVTAMLPAGGGGGAAFVSTVEVRGKLSHLGRWKG
jgi:hypothetical protein